MKSKYFLLVLLLAFFLPRVSALETASITIVNFNDYSNDCGQTPYYSMGPMNGGVLLTYRLNFTGFTVDAGWNADVYAVIVRDGNGMIIGSDYNQVPTGSPYIFGESGRVYINDNNSSQLGAIANPPQSRPWSFEVYDMRGNVPSLMTNEERYDFVMSQPIVGVTEIDPAAFSTGCDALPFVGDPADYENLNSGVGVLEAQFFTGQDEAGNPSINIYEVNGAGEGYFVFQITENSVAPFIGNPPDNNLELMASASGKVIFYVLSTGEFQINVGPDKNGEVFVYIFDSIPPEDITTSSFNIYDILDE